MHPLGYGECLLASFNAASARDNRQARAANSRGRVWEANDGVVLLNVAADQLIRLGDLDDFLHSRHFFERALLDFTLVAGDANGGALRTRHGMRTVSQLFDLLTNGAHLLFGSVRLHDD